MWKTRAAKSRDDTDKNYGKVYLCQCCPSEVINSRNLYCSKECRERMKYLKKMGIKPANPRPPNGNQDPYFLIERCSHHEPAQGHVFSMFLKCERCGRQDWHSHQVAPTYCLRLINVLEAMEEAKT